MRRILSVLLPIFIIQSQIVACSTQKAKIDYQDFNDKGVALKSGTFSDGDLGRVTGSDGGAIWDNCSVKARESVKEMIDEAQAKGANAIGNIYWHASGTSEPRCKKAWGYFLLFPFLLTPLFMRTEVEGIAYKASKLSADMIPLPNNDEEKKALIISLAGEHND